MMAPWQPGKVILQSQACPSRLYYSWPATAEEKEVVEIVDKIIWKMMEVNK